MVAMTFTSCEPEEKPDTKTIDTHGTIDVKFKQIFDGTNTIVQMDEFVYNNNGTLVKTFLKFDTLPGLGNVVDTLDTGRTYEDENGDDQEIDTMIIHPKPYQFYIAVKPNN